VRALAAAALLLALLPAALAARSPLQDARSGLDTLATLHGADGSFDAGMAPLIVEAAVAVGTDPAAWPTASHPVLASLRPPGGPDLLAQVRSIHARAVAGHGTAQDVAAVQGAFHDGQFGDPLLLNDDIWAIRALRALGVSRGDDLVQAAAHRLAGQQGDDGGWSWRLGAPSSTDVTGMALVSLQEVQALPPDGAARAGAYLAARQAGGPDGGYAADTGASNCDSTVWAIRGLQALGTPAPATAWQSLAGLHQSDGGFAYQAGQPSNALCTAEAATLLGEWASAGRDLSAYSGAAAKGSPAAGVTLLLAALGLAAARRRA
jgi:hypothetical protein